MEDFRAAARRGERPSGVVERLTTESPSEVAGAYRTLHFVFSDESVDLAGDRILVQGWKLSNFLRNPVALWSHDSSTPPIGRAKNVKISGDRLVGDIEFATADTFPLADTIYRLLKDRFVRAVSVGFKPTSWEFSRDPDRPLGIDFRTQELLEISVCSVPCNPNALVMARSKGIDTRPIETAFETASEAERRRQRRLIEARRIAINALRN